MSTPRIDQTQTSPSEEKEQPSPAPAEARWYIVHAYSGQEERVAKAIRQRVESLDLADRVLEVKVPLEQVVEIREGQRIKKTRPMFPGYILVRMVLDERTWAAVRNTPGVTGFISADTLTEKPQPVPLGPQEVEAIFKRMESGHPLVKVGFTKGQQVKIVGGLFKDFIGTVDEIYPDKGRVRVLVSFFGRETPVELDLLEVERIA
ncbi:MAG: transcription termination/antitermination protein NusG [Dehalococcoidia bacterium]|nr:transcription termination/antitermination protein NusG [Dehalococcoidia bacterium]MDW8119041.1 transcription termination/antitermination protein NusG [Chloroflexota bacterium]